jgi:hypothetical protein
MAEILEFDKMFYTNFEPKMKTRYIMEIDGIDAYLIKKAARPTIKFETLVMNHINIKRKIQGKGEWEDIKLELYDPIVPSAAQKVMEWVRLGHESITGRRGYADFYKKDITIKILGPVGDVVEKWKLKGAFLVNVDFSDLDYSSDDPMQIDIDLAYDYAILEY